MCLYIKICVCVYIYISLYTHGLPWWLSGKESVCNKGDKETWV